MTQHPSWIGSTQGIVGGWRVIVHWHDVEGRIVAAGVEVRGYDVPDDSALSDTDGTPDPDHSLGYFPKGRAARDVTSGLMGHRIKWGAEIGRQLGQLVDSLGRSAEDDPAGLGAWADDAAVRAEQSGRRAPRATDETYRLVAVLYREAQADPASRGRTALAVLRLLRERHGFPLSDDNDSDRAKVRAWIAEAKRRHPDEFRGPSDLTRKPTANTNRRRSK